MSDYVTRGVYLPVHDRRNSISHFFLPFNKIFVRIIQSSVLTVESLIGQRSAERAASLCTCVSSLVKNSEF